MRKSALRLASVHWVRSWLHQAKRGLPRSFWEMTPTNSFVTCKTVSQRRNWLAPTKDMRRWSLALLASWKPPATTSNFHSTSAGRPFNGKCGALCGKYPLARRFHTPNSHARSAHRRLFGPSQEHAQPTILRWRSHAIGLFETTGLCPDMRGALSANVGFLIGKSRGRLAKLKRDG